MFKLKRILMKSYMIFPFFKTTYT